MINQTIQDLFTTETRSTQSFLGFKYMFTLSLLRDLGVSVVQPSSDFGRL
jgi:hypothetical protein